MNNPPIQVAYGWERDETKFMSNSIRYLTRPGWSPKPMAQWSHMFLVFRFEDGTAEIHEALTRTGWSKKPAVEFTEWLAADPVHRHGEIHWLPIDSPIVEQIYTESLSWVGNRGYDFRQIAAFAIADSVLGRVFGFHVGSGSDGVFCSEGACQIVGEFSPRWDLRQYPDERWDTIVPQAAYNSFWWRMDRLMNDLESE